MSWGIACRVITEFLCSLMPVKKFTLGKELFVCNGGVGHYAKRFWGNYVSDKVYVTWPQPLQKMLPTNYLCNACGGGRNRSGHKETFKLPGGWLGTTSVVRWPCPAVVFGIELWWWPIPKKSIIGGDKRHEYQIEVGPKKKKTGWSQTQTDQNGPRQTKMDQNRPFGPYWFRECCNPIRNKGHFDQNGRLDCFGPLWSQVQHTFIPAVRQPLLKKGSKNGLCLFREIENRSAPKTWRKSRKRGFQALSTKAISPDDPCCGKAI